MQHHNQRAAVSLDITLAVLVAMHPETLERVVTLPVLLAITPIILEMVTLLGVVLTVAVAPTPLLVILHLVLALLVGTPVLVPPAPALATVTTSITAPVITKPKSWLPVNPVLVGATLTTLGTEVVVCQHMKIIVRVLLVQHQ